MKITCTGCGQEYDAITYNDIYQHYIKSPTDIMPNTKDFCKLVFKICERLENEKKLHKSLGGRQLLPGNPSESEFACYQNILLLQSLLEHK